MGKECFTCDNKITKELTQEERTEIKEENKRNGKIFARIPELTFTCRVTGKQIKQTDPACDEYKPNEDMVYIRKELAKTAKKLREELENGK